MYRNKYTVEVCSPDEANKGANVHKICQPCVLLPPFYFLSLGDKLRHKLYEYNYLFISLSSFQISLQETICTGLQKNVCICIIFINSLRI